MCVGYINGYEEETRRIVDHLKVYGTIVCAKWEFASFAAEENVGDRGTNFWYSHTILRGNL